jgi:hypothetical protein
VWNELKPTLHQGNPVTFASRKRSRSGRKPKQINYEQLCIVPLKDRTTLVDTSKVAGVSKKTLLKHVKEGKVRRYTSSIKPHLTDENKKARLQWCVDMLDHESLHDNPRFKTLFDHVFIDEKWFFISCKSERYYLLPDEDEPHRTCRSKNTSLSSCSCVPLLVQDLRMEFALSMERLGVFLWLDLRLLEGVVLTDQLEQWK